MNKIELNSQFEHVLNFVNQTNQLVFLTGKAGTGKTTLLKYIKEHTIKQMAVVAPTGVAAINAGGSTIHSFFQFAFAPFLPVLKENGVPDFSKNNLPALKYNAQRLSIFRKLELLVIDEISMVRADLLDQVDITLRQTRKKWHQPFGGVQVMLIGDMHQLPPVVQQEEWKLLEGTYASPYFFDSLVVRNNRPVYIELEKIYRQKEQAFIDILNKVRNNQLTKADFEILNSHYRPSLPKEFVQDNITLTTHNRKADELNTELLNALPDRAYTFRSKVDGIFNEKNYPAEEQLVLKKGARVMFLKNNNEKNYYNGKIGIVTYINDETIKVKCAEDHAEIEVGKETWTNVNYTINKQSKGLEEEILGTFIQFPLRLAWAITIHKSQGLSFDKVIIDAGASFSAGQVYVALSRCRGLSGLTLSSRISESVLFNDKNIQNFSSTRQKPEEVSEIFNSSKLLYFKTLLLDLFDFSNAWQERQDLAGAMQLYKTRIHPTGQEWVSHFSAGLDKIYETGNKFRNPLSGLIDGSRNPDQDEALQKRVKEAVSYFYTEIDALLVMFKTIPAFTESKEAAEELNPSFQKLFDELFAKNSLMKTSNQGFNMDRFLDARAKMQYPTLKINVYENARNTATLAGVNYPDLYKQLLFLRDEICNDEHKPIYLVANAKSLKELTDFLPVTPEELLKISGFGEAKVEAFGDRFLKIIKEYVEEHNIQVDRSALTEKREKKKTTKQSKARSVGDDGSAEPAAEKKPSREQTYELYKQGLSLSEIALVRKFSVTTLEGHLASYVASGDIHVDALVQRDKQDRILKALDGFDKASGLTAVKSKLPDDVSYSEIKYVMAYKNFVEGQ